MKFTLALKAILLLLLLKQIKSDYCQNSFYGSPCAFQYGYQGVNCTNFIFYNCSWQECVGYQTVGNDTVCIQYQTFTNQAWDSCMQRCCDSSYSYDYSQNSFQKCEEDKKYSNLNVIIAFIPIIGGIVIAVITFYIVFCCCRHRLKQSTRLKLQNNSCFRCLLCMKEPEENIGQIIGQNRSKQLQLSLINKWNKEQFQNQVLFENCCICLDYRPTLQLQCSHVHHRNCIIAWIKRKQECPLCRVSKFSKVKVYCEKCLHQYFEVNLLAQKNEIESTMQICNSCKLRQ